MNDMNDMNDDDIDDMDDVDDGAKAGWDYEDEDIAEAEKFFLKGIWRRFDIEHGAARHLDCVRLFRVARTSRHEEPRHIAEEYYTLWRSNLLRAWITDGYAPTDADIRFLCHAATRSRLVDKDTFFELKGVFYETLGVQVVLIHNGPGSAPTIRLVNYFKWRIADLSDDPSDEEYKDALYRIMTDGTGCVSIGDEERERLRREIFFQEFV